MEPTVQIDIPEDETSPKITIPPSHWDGQSRTCGGGPRSANFEHRVVLAVSFILAVFFAVLVVVVVLGELAMAAGHHNFYYSHHFFPPPPGETATSLT